ncbi:SDR family oxidoreductase [Bradyrhizobium genosp. P]|uniref:SDR family oxidoreductase n=1 Tax=Bradyrhizobium genosp. P TaxID=83641 RepID=UPI003CF1CB6B
MPDQTRPILVTGATGRQGRSVASTLIERGFRIRALVRRREERSAAVEALGAEITVGDYGDYASLLKALENVKSAYFCYPVGAGAAGLFATAGKERGLERISICRCDPQARIARRRKGGRNGSQKRSSNGRISRSSLRIAAFFMENILKNGGPEIRKTGRIANAFGNAALSVDVGRLAAALLANETLTQERVLAAPPLSTRLFRGRRNHRRDHREACRIYRTGADEWRRILIWKVEEAGEPNPRGADHLVAQSAALRTRTPMPVSDLWQRMAGTQPTSFTHFIEAH